MTDPIVTFVGRGHSEAIIEVRHKPGFLGRLFGQRTTVGRYRGSGTVWHDNATGARMPTHIEMRLVDIWTKARWDAEEAAVLE